MTHQCIILGGGGHARVLIDCLLDIGNARIIGVLDADVEQWGRTLYGVPVLGGDDLLEKLAGEQADCFVVGLGSTRDNGPRRRLFEKGLSCRLTPLIVKHPASFCSPRSQTGDGSQLLAGSIINAGASLGSNVIVNTGAIIEHDCIVGDHVHVATGARVCGGVTLESMVFVGAGATIRQGIHVGEGAVVGAGAVVVKDVAASTVVAGNPARPIAKR